MARSSVILALAAIAVSAPTYAVAQSGSDDAFLARCEILRGLSRSQLDVFIREHPGDPCSEIAALMLTRAQSTPAQGENTY